MKKIIENVYSVGAIHWDRRLFDELIPLPDGTSYNAYLIMGSEKTALIDTVDPATKEQLINHLKEFKGLKIDYIISNHAEQDHSGTIPDILEANPEARVVTNKKCMELLIKLLHIPSERFITIEDGEILSLGDRTLKFIFTPWVHWPETMCTYLAEGKILFSCDFFGAHTASPETFVKDLSKAEESAKRYYAEIMMPFRNFISSNLKKLEEYDIKIIAPSHGQVYSDPNFIIALYRDWVSDAVKNEVVIPYVSMHGSTNIIVEKLTEALMERGIDVYPFNLSHADIGEIAIKTVDSATIVIATPTVLTGPHPLTAYITIFLNAIKPKTKFMGIINSYGWGSITVNWLTQHLSNFKGEFIEPLEIKGLPTEEDLDKVNKLAEKIHTMHKSLGII